ncbi:MAG: flagellar export protein FliJ [Acidobacteriota bacterium]|jgi:flagellar export protein FliJ|nr:flagellar export protein FliJ [Acidobacteriota bacterium]
MPKFRFSLQALLRRREDAEQTARDEMMLRVSRQQQEQQKLEDLKNRRNENASEMAAKQLDNTAYDELIYYRMYLDRLDYEIDNSHRRLVRLSAEVEVQRKVLVEASKKRKTLTLLRDKKEKEFKLALDKTFQKEIDDLVVLRHKRA